MSSGISFPATRAWLAFSIRGYHVERENGGWTVLHDAIEVTHYERSDSGGLSFRLFSQDPVVKEIADRLGENVIYAYAHGLQAFGQETSTP